MCGRRGGLLPFATSRSSDRLRESSHSLARLDHALTRLASRPPATSNQRADAYAPFSTNCSPPQASWPNPSATMPLWANHRARSPSRNLLYRLGAVISPLLLCLAKLALAPHRMASAMAFDFAIPCPKCPRVARVDGSTYVLSASPSAPDHSIDI